MFEVGWSEILIVAVVALIVVGPKELPTLLRTIGRYTGMAKRQFDSLKAQFDAAVSEADLDLVRKEMEAVRQAADKEAARTRTALEAVPQTADDRTP